MLFDYTINKWNIKTEDKILKLFSGQSISVLITGYDENNFMT